MKIAILIGAYKNPTYLDGLIQSLATSKTNVYVHINKYNIGEFTQLIDKYNNVDNVHVYSEYAINWGGTGLLKSQMFVLNKALEDKENGYFHFITGQDILIKSVNELVDFSTKNSNKNFVHVIPFNYEWWMGRYMMYHLFDLINYRKNIINKSAQVLSSRLQKLLHIKRSALPFNKLYAGSSWWSINRSVAQLFVDFFGKEENLKRMKYTCAPDEMYYQSILMNSPLAETNTGENLCYLKWTGEGGSPKLLDENDFQDLKNTCCFFARKVEPDKSAKLIELIKNHIQ